MDDSDSSDEMDFVRETLSAKYFDKPAKDTQVIDTNVNNSSKLIKSPLGSSTPVSDSKNSVSSINLIRTKQLKQLHKHLAKNVADKQISVDFVKSPENFEKDNYSSSSKIFKNSNHYVKSKLSSVSKNNMDSSDDANNLSSCSNLQSDSGISNDEHRQLQSPLQNPLLSKSDTSLLSTKKLKYSDKNFSVILNSVSPNKIKSRTSLTNQNIVLGSNTDYSSKKDEDNSVYTQYMVNPDNQNSTQSIHNSASSDKDTLNKSKSPNKSKINTLRLSTRSINKNDMVKLQSDTKFSMLSDVDSSSNEHIELSVPHTIQEVDFNKEIKNNTINNLPAPKKNITTAQCTSSSDDEVYTKLKLNLSKMENAKPDIEKTEYQNSHSVYSSDNESDLSSVGDTSSVSSLKVTKSNTSPNKCINISLSDNCHLSNYNNVSPNKGSEDARKKLNKKSVLDESSMYSNNKSKLFLNLSNNENNSNKMVKHILKDSSNSDELMNQKVCNIIPTSSISKLERFTKPIINKEFSNPYLKVNSTNSTSSSEDEAFVTDLTINNSKKNSTPLDTKNVKKNTLIQKLITSIKYEDQLSKQNWIAQDIYSSSSEESKIAEVFTSNESLKETKNEKSILKNLKNPIEESNLSNVNISQESNPLQLPIKSSSDSSTDDEIDFIKKIVEKRKLNINDRQKSTMKNNPANLSKSIKPFKKLTSYPMKKPEETKNLVLESFNKESTTSKTLPSVKTNELFNSINTKNEKPINSKDLLIENMLNSIDDSYSTMINKNITQSHILSNASKKKSKKSTLLNASLDTTDKSFKNNTIKRKKKKSKKTKKLLVDTIMNFLEDSSDTTKNNSPSQLNELSKISGKKNNKSEPLKQSMIITDKSSKKKKIKETKDLLLDNRICSVDNFSSTIDSNYLTQLNRMTETIDTKNKKLSPAETVVLTDELVSDTMKKRKKKPKVSKDLFLDSIINSLADSSSTMKHNKKRSRESKASMIEFSNNDTLFKKKKTNYYSTTNKINKLKINSPGRSLPEICKKKKKRTELQYDTKCSTLKDKKKEYDPPIECKTNDKNIFTDKKEKKKKMKKVELLLNDPTQHNIQSASTEKMLTAITELNTNMKNRKKIESINKKKKVSKNELKDFLSTQKSPLINNLDSLYSSLKF